ncbi:B-cell receptor CD22 isoform X3 [Xiphias gladius]|uniref:B-cell receptor CD22 isoform X3 n=1 Tax=Xiphias gladius TaxID=8245 RepID=UPI001A97F1B4|nr:B-cell receptor CD22 isoform X3 [Xiphias gladius]
MTQLSNTASTFATRRKMWHIKVLSVIYFTAICAAEDPQAVTSMFTDVSPYTSLPTSMESPIVYELPIPSLRLQSVWLDVFPSEKVELNCSISGSSDWTITWHRNKDQVQDGDPNLYISPDRSMLIITAATQMYSGNYHCEGRHKTKGVATQSSKSLEVNVYENKPKPTVSRRPNFDKMFPGESVIFTCMVNTSFGWEYLWYHDGNEIQAPNTDTYTIDSIEHSNSGEYHCKAKRGKGPFYTEGSKTTLLLVSEKKPKPLMTQKPDVDTVYMGESVSFECKVGISSGWEYLWYKDGKALLHNGSSFNIRDASSSDSGTYECMAKREESMYHGERSDRRILQISEIPVPSLKQMTQWLDVFPTESVKLSCGMQRGSDWIYMWYKDGQKVQADNTVSFDLNGATLSISSASASYRGQYSCLGKLKSRPVTSNPSSELTLSVYDTKPRVTLMQNPEHNVMYTEDSVSFSCHINVSSGWEYLWYKDGNQLTESGNNLNISLAETTNTGLYKCQVKRGVDTFIQSDQSQALRLNIQERPKAHIILLTGWSEVFATDSLVLRCEVQESNDKWNYTWFKEEQPLNLLPSERHIVTPHDDPEQSLYTCHGIRSGRPSYSKRSDSFRTKNLLLKRRVLLSISGCLFFGLVATFLGCIILRVIRKPAGDEDKPEEDNLFLTMAQLKSRADAPCPLVEYITDTTLNAPSKEGDENGTICCETTPLTTQEDQAVTTESHDAEESNGGLVSFKQ